MNFAILVLVICCLATGWSSASRPKLVLASLGKREVSGEPSRDFLNKVLKLLLGEKVDQGKQLESRSFGDDGGFRATDLTTKIPTTTTTASFSTTTQPSTTTTTTTAEFTFNVPPSTYPPFIKPYWPTILGLLGRGKR